MTWCWRISWRCTARAGTRVTPSPREIVFFRVKHVGNTAYLPAQHGVTEEMRHMAAVLSDPWLEWPGLADVAADSGASRVSTAAPRL